MNHRILYIFIVTFSIINPLEGLCGVSNGGFEQQSSGNYFIDWSLSGGTYAGWQAGVTTPAKNADLKFTSWSAGNSISSVFYNATTQSQYDWFLLGASPTPTVKIPGFQLRSAAVNLTYPTGGSTTNGVVSGTSNKPSGWTTYSKRASQIQQTFTVTASDIDAIDGKIHIRMAIAPVLENPAHAIDEQPFFTVQLENNTTGRTGANPLYFLWNFANQSGVPWKTLTSAGTNSGANANYQYSDWQTLDIAPGNAFIRPGDSLTLTVLASGCLLGGHDAIHPS